jgi:ABC-type glycerol-3-phosphate transport system substrate-binding protein
MEDKLYNWDGKKLEIFSYFLPTWGLHYVLKPNAESTAGDWAMIPGPVPYRWGGNWLAAWKNTQNPQAAKELIRYLTTDDYVMESYVNATGDMTSNIAVQERVKNNFNEPFLGGQNQYALFADISRHVSGKLSQANDQVINELFQQAVFEHLWEGKPKAQALSDFRVHVLSRLNIH